MEEKIGLRQYWDVPRIRWKIVVVLLIIAVLTSGVVSFFVIKLVYQPSTMLIVEVMGTQPLPLQGSAPVNILNFQILTVPSYNSGEMSNGTTVDMSGAPDTTQVTGFSVTVDQSCDLQLDGVDKTIPLSGGQATLVNLDDLIGGTHGGDGISLRTFRKFYDDSVTIQGELKKNSSVVGNLLMTLKL